MNRRLCSYVLFLVFSALVIALGLSGNIEAQEPQGPPKGELDFTSLADLYVPGRARPANSPADISADPLHYSRVAYMSWKDNNWEIYTQERSSGGLARRTYNEAADVTPRLNIGATKIVFASNRDGDYEIFSMDYNGNNVHQLTFNGSGDSNPSWSRDSQQIVFESDRDGQVEIYSMKADGSGQKRLTYDPAYDADPSLSPDGSKIVFNSSRNGYGIWIMNADGSNAHQLTSWTFSQNPVWSPDGQYIAFDADSTGNGWNEIWIMKADGSAKTKIYEYGNTTDPYVRSWSPDGRFIAYTKVDWFYYQGDWYWYSARTEYIEAKPGSYPSTLVYDQDLEWYPDWQSTDITPPQSSVQPLPEYSRDNAIVHWSGSDDSSGVENYDIQYRVGQEGVWQDWLVNTGATQSTFSKLPGEKVYFRSRAADWAGLEEEWPTGDGDASTTFYNWAISGTVIDNRLIPIPGVTVSSTQHAFINNPSDENGVYSAYFDGYDSTFQIDLQKAGYGSLPTGVFSILEDGYLDALLPPSDNVVADPGFESPTTLSDTWQTGGAIPAQVSSEQKHTGNQSVFLGQPFGLEVVAQFDADPNFASKPGPKLDDTGTFHLVWYVGGTGNDKTIYYARGDGDGNWIAPETVTPAPTAISNMLWDVSPAGLVHVVWEGSAGSYDIIYHMWRDNGGWHGPTIVYNLGRANLYTLRADSQGGAHLLWQLTNTGFDDTYYSYVNASGVWSSPDRLFVPYDTEAYNLVLDKEDVVHLQWNYSGDDLLHNYRKADGSWSERELVAPGGYNWYNDLLIDDNNGVHLVWGNASSGKIFHSKRQADGSWSGPTYVSAGTGAEPSTVRAAAGPGGSLVIGWLGGSYSCRQPYAAFIDSAGVWTRTKKLNPGSDCTHSFSFQHSDQQLFLYTNHRPASENHFCLLPLEDSPSSLVGQCAWLPVPAYGTDSPLPIMDQDGVSHVFWRLPGLDGIREVVHSRVVVNETAATSSVWQEVQLPPELVHPTLSFAYLWQETGQSPEGSLRLSVNNGVSTTVAFSGTGTADWQYEWVDLEPWSGETVTLTFELDQEGGSTGLQAFLDEVYLGSAYPDSWLTVEEHGPAFPGEPMALQIDYGNRSTALAAGGQIILTLPPGLSYVESTPAPATVNGTLTWDVGALSQGSAGPIVVTVLVSDTLEAGTLLPVLGELESATAELATENNLFALDVLVLRPMYLPFVAH